jgi:hypothetical protein
MAKKCDALEIQTDPVQAPLEILAKMMAGFGAKLVELPADPMARVPMRLVSFRSHEITYSPWVSEFLA